jgi:hypothetical protein
MALADGEAVDSTVIASETPIPLPNTSSTLAKDAPHAFFAFQSQGQNSSTQAAAQASASPSKISLEMLRRPLLLPEPLREKGLTRSQLLFSAGTTIDPRALRITEDDEFYLFMDMRAELQWTTFGMTASKWASATKTYNERLERIAKKKNIEFIRKNPRALADKLSEVEPMIAERNFKQDFTGT